MEDINKKLNEDLFKCNTRMSLEETQILGNAFDLMSYASNMLAKEKQEGINKLKDKILRNTKLKVVK